MLEGHEWCDLPRAETGVVTVADAVAKAVSPTHGLIGCSGELLVKPNRFQRPLMRLPLWFEGEGGDQALVSFAGDSWDESGLRCENCVAKFASPCVAILTFRQQLNTHTLIQ